MCTNTFDNNKKSYSLSNYLFILIKTYNYLYYRYIFQIITFIDIEVYVQNISALKCTKGYKHGEYKKVSLLLQLLGTRHGLPNRK